MERNYVCYPICVESDVKKTHSAKKKTNNENGMLTTTITYKQTKKNQLFRSNIHKSINFEQMNNVECSYTLVCTISPYSVDQVAIGAFV